MTRIFTNGTFDVLHPGHVALLRYAASLGDYLLVALDSDERIAARKGPSRPVNSLYARTTLMSALRGVDEVRSFSSDAELEAIVEDYRPSVMVVGSDWRGKRIVGAQYAARVEYFERTTSDSTSEILNNYLLRLREKF
jgi:D-beta-D-heptose 7-phosphate kinase/D-beta-D-heptose 1-phosphate adenosyltransferase